MEPIVVFNLFFCFFQFSFHSRFDRTHFPLLSQMELPTNIIDEANMAMEDTIIPKASADAYEKTYTAFMEWKEKMKTTSNDERVLLAYFKHLRTLYAPSTLWVKYSHLNAQLLLKTGSSLQEYVTVKKFIRRANEGYFPKKAAILTLLQIQTFLRDAPPTYLLSKVILILGFFGAMRSSDLHDIQASCVTEEENLVKIEFYERKNKRYRTYYVGNSGDGPDVLTIIRTYLKLRKNVEGITQFLLQIRKGKITRQAVGKTTIANNCQEVARYLNLEHPETYTGHCNRRS